jgi:protein-tyrosine phosphatase
MKKNIVYQYGLVMHPSSDDEARESTELTEAALRVSLSNLSFTLKDGRPIKIPLRSMKLSEGENTSFHKDYLYIGSIGSAYNLQQLLSHGITHILCLSSVIRLRFPDQFKYLRIDMVDKPDYDLSSDLSTIFDFIFEAKSYTIANTHFSSSTGGRPTDNRPIKDDDVIDRSGDNCRNVDDESIYGDNNDAKRQLVHGKVLIHCYQGKSRSVAVCCAYLMRFYEYSLDEALQLVRSVRPTACPNHGFMQQLMDLSQRPSKDLDLIRKAKCNED